MGLKEQREWNNKSKVTQELVDRKVMKKKNIQEIEERKKRESLTEMKKEEKIATWKNMTNWAT